MGGMANSKKMEPASAVLTDILTERILWASKIAFPLSVVHQQKIGDRARQKDTAAWRRAYQSLMIRWRRPRLQALK
jgi:hypothetical protein